ncbi:MAG TPA: cytochrome c oxidase subunit 3 [Terriglobales bacterium]|nr:cytochrome c oxidase subunit 3 [Terriglobales bacterium]
MATMNPTLTLDKRHGGRPPDLPPHGGGDDGNDAAGDAPGYYERLRRYRLGVAIGLASVVMLFVALTSAYIVRQGLSSWDDHAGQYVVDWRPIPLPTALLAINTLVLLASSFTLEKSRRSLNRYAATVGLHVPGVAEEPERSFPWMGITLVLGFAFLAGQVTAWHELRRAGVFLATNPSGSFFYVLTGAHAAHLMGGLLALLYAACMPLLHKPLDSRRLAVDATGWYWHFMGLLWIYIFALLHFSR